MARPFWDEQSDDIKCGACHEVLRFNAYEDYVCIECGARVHRVSLKDLEKKYLSVFHKRWLEICQVLDLDPASTQSGSLSWKDDAAKLEKIFPGTSCAWDVNPTTRHWSSHYMKVVSHWTATEIRLIAYKLNDMGALDRVRIKPMGMHEYTIIRAEYTPSEEAWTVIR